MENLKPFDELILSWNGVRPEKKVIDFWVQMGNSPWIKAAHWGPSIQKSYIEEVGDVKTYQDAVQSLKSCTRFAVRCDEALHLSVTLSKIGAFKPNFERPEESCLLDQVEHISQMLLPHPRRKDLCSPTASAIALQYLTKKPIDPLRLASECWDAGFDIYGNWALNVAAIFNHSRHSCRVERLQGALDLLWEIKNQRPCVVSVQGELSLAPLPYHQGHLMCVIGVTPDCAICLDPASTSSSPIHYPWDEFLRCWANRRNLSYVFRY